MTYANLSAGSTARRLSRGALVAAVFVFGPTGASAIPAVGHVHLQCLVQRMNVNDYSIRKQVKAVLTISAQDAAQLTDLDAARLTVTNPALVSARVRPYRIQNYGGRFKAAHAAVELKLIEDSGSRTDSNVPAGFFAAEGPYRLRIDLRGQSYRGQFSFAAPVALRVSQSGALQRNFVLDPKLPIEIVTLPDHFGPVYYKQQDVANFLYQLAGMDDALKQGDYHAAVESPQFFFQLRAGNQGEEDTKMVDPAAYLPGAEQGLVRGESAQSPLTLPADAFPAGQTLVLDFSRSETPAPDSVFTGDDANFSSQLKIQERVLYVFAIGAKSAAALNAPAPAPTSGWAAPSGAAR